MTANIKHSGIFTGEIFHTRRKHKHHHFSYKVFMMYLDLDELDDVFSLSPLWSLKRYALARFKPEDYFYDDALGSVKKTVQQYIYKETGDKFEGRVCLLTNLRYFGFVINPISCYYCFDQDNELKYVIAEVTNTPWKERQHYLMDVGSEQSQGSFSCRFDKKMHVSPFMENDMQYHFTGTLPPAADNKTLLINLNNIEAGKPVFNARLSLSRKAITATSLNLLLIQFPFLTVKVFAAIHWQALKLFLKGVPIIRHINKQELADEI